MSLIQSLTGGVTPGGIDSLKAVFAKRDGLARANRFAIFMNPPTQSILNFDAQGLIASAASGNFDANKFVNDPRDIAILCESCSFPGRQITTIEYPQQGFRQSVKYTNGYINEDISFTFHLTGDYYIKKMFDAWSNVCLDPVTYTVPYDEDYKTDVVIQQLNEQNIPVYGVKLRNAFPVSIQGIELSNASSDTTQKLTVTIAYDDYAEEGALTSALSGAKNVFGSLTNLGI